MSLPKSIVIKECVKCEELNLKFGENGFTVILGSPVK